MTGCMLIHHMLLEFASGTLPATLPLCAQVFDERLYDADCVLEGK